MVFVKQLDMLPIAERILLARKIAIQRNNLVNADFNRSIAQYAEIKPLTSLYKPILDSMTGIFQDRTNFKLRKDDKGIEFTDDGIIAFVDDLSSKNIRSSSAIANALGEVSSNAPNVGQPRANYARELAQKFAAANNSEMTTAEIIETIKPSKGKVAEEEDVDIDDIAERLEALRPRTTRPLGEEEPLPAFKTPAPTPITPKSAPSVLTEEQMEEQMMAGKDLIRGKIEAFKRLNKPSRSKEERAQYRKKTQEVLKQVIEGGKLAKDMFRAETKMTDLSATQKEVLESLDLLDPSVGSGVHFITGKGAMNKLKVLIGQYNAGNTSKLVRKQMKDLGDALYKQGLLSKKDNLAIQKIN